LSTAEGGRVHFRAEKSVCAREAEGQAAGRGSFGTFLAAKKSTRKNRKVFQSILYWIAQSGWVMTRGGRLVKPGNDKCGGG